MRRKRARAPRASRLAALPDSWPECGCPSRHRWRHDICTYAFAHAASHTSHNRGRPPKMVQSSPPMRLIELSTHSCRCGDSPPPLETCRGRGLRLPRRGTSTADNAWVFAEWPLLRLAACSVHRDARDRACAGDNWAAWEGAYAHRDAHRSVAEDVASKRAVASYDDGLQRRPPPVVAAARAAR